MSSEQLNVATPEEAVALVPPVQLKVAPAVPVPEVMARETTVAVSVLTRLPEESCTETPTEKFDPAGELAGGCVLTASLERTPELQSTPGAKSAAFGVPSPDAMS